MVGSRPIQTTPPGVPLLTVAVACIGFFLITLDATVVNVALPTIGVQLHGDISALQWVVDSYTLVFAAFMLCSGSVSDRIGAGRAFSLGLALFSAASAVCGLAPTLGWLIAARAAQGLAAAAMLPSSLALVRQSVPTSAARARAVAWWTAGGGVAVSSGPVIGGVLTNLLGWRSIFLINIPVGAAGLLGMTRVRRSPARAAPLDPFGQVLIVLALGSLTYGVIDADRHPATTVSVFAALSVFALSSAGFVLAEKHAAHPSIPYEQFRRPTVVSCTLTGFALNFTYFGIVFVLSVFFQQQRHIGPLDVGLMFLPMTALIMIMNLVVGRIVNRYGPRRPMVAGQLLQALGFLTVLLVGPSASPLAHAIALIPIGLGVGLTSPPMMTALLEAVDPDRAGLASGFLHGARQTGSALGVAVLGALIADSHHLDTGLDWSLAISATAVLMTAISSTLLIPSTPSDRPTHGRDISSPQVNRSAD